MVVHCQHRLLRPVDLPHGAGSYYRFREVVREVVAVVAMVGQARATVQDLPPHNLDNTPVRSGSELASGFDSLDK